MKEPRIEQVDGVDRAADLKKINAAFPEHFLPLKDRHLRDGFWWIASIGSDAVGFAGNVPFIPFPRAGYFKRVGVLDSYRLSGLSKQLTAMCVNHARQQTDWTHLISECSDDNFASANNLMRAGFKLCEAERPWAKKTLFWTMKLK